MNHQYNQAGQIKRVTRDNEEYLTPYRAIQGFLLLALAIVPVIIILILIGE
tara:strand:+ start:58 stop:210 length:153 start_codon:yes stop_codon:yes gene_type:complete